MDSESSSIRIDKLSKENYHSWKQKILLVLSLRDLDDQINTTRPDDDTAAAAWDKKDRKARATIGLTISDELLENVREVKTAAAMWLTIRNVFERHTLLNKLSARRKFYSATKSEDESVLQFANRIRQLTSTLKSMGVNIDESEMAMAFLCGLPEPYDPLISALDAIGTEEGDLEFEHVTSRVLQEEQRIGFRIAEATSKSETKALTVSCQGSCVNCNVATNSRPKCSHCGKLGHTHEKCWKKHPHLNPHKKVVSEESGPAFIASESEYDPNVICLIGNAVKSHKGSQRNEWFIDSGCSNHMTFDRTLFTSLESAPLKTVTLGNGATAEISGQGTVQIDILLNGEIVCCKLNNVLLVPELGYQLLSVSSLSMKGFTTAFEGRKCDIKQGRTVVASGTLQGSLYRLDTVKGANTALVSSTLQVWHERFAHVDPSVIQNMVNNNVVSGVEIQDSNASEMKCEGCVLGKGHRTPIPKKSSSRSSKILELVHSDVNGPLETPSMGGSRYFITFIDDYSKWTEVYTMRKKSDSLKYFKIYHKYVQVFTGKHLDKINIIQRTKKSLEELKSIRTDNGGEYISNDFKSYLQENGISHQLTVAYTPQQNGIAERMNRTLVDLVRSMIHTANLDKSFWAEALATAVYIRNRVTSRSLPPRTTPHHLWKRVKPELGHLRIFGSNCFYTVPKSKVKKLDARSQKAIFMGYSTQSKGYKLWDPQTRRMIVSRDVTFRESIRKSAGTEECTIESGDSSNREGESEMRFDETPDNITQSSNEYEGEKDIVADNSELENDGAESESEPETPKSLRRSYRNFTKTKPFWKQYSSFSATALSAETVPFSYKSATSESNIDFWKPGIDHEHDCLLRNNTWTIVERVPGTNVLPCKYVFRIKNGLPKARMVVLGNKQIFGIDYYHTYAPVVKFATIRTLLAVVAAEDFECEQMDVVTAFLNGDLDEDIYMQVPEGLKTPANTGKVCKLNKALYGLKQAPRQWYAKIHVYLVEQLNFKSSPNDPCLYIRKTPSDIIIIALYVDDLLIIGNSKFKILQLKGEFKRRFEMKEDRKSVV